ncbi:prepilin-type N-terminal cleavage/methylation domain-containing protein [bacterium]|nr:prepilin-type N-terminal cleavage/methylation domain-containing protein [bacterium]
MNTRQRGFSLIDLMIILAVLTMLAAIAIPSINNSQRDENTLICLSHQEEIANWIAEYVTVRQVELTADKDAIIAAIDEYIASNAETRGFVPAEGNLEDEFTVPNVTAMVEAGYPAELFVNRYAEEDAPVGTGFVLKIKSIKNEETGATEYQVRLETRDNYRYRVGPSGGLLSDPETTPTAADLISIGAPENIFTCLERADRDEALGSHYALSGVTGDIECATDVKGDRRDPNALFVHTLE